MQTSGTLAEPPRPLLSFGVCWVLFASLIGILGGPQWWRFLKHVCLYSKTTGTCAVQCCIQHNFNPIFGPAEYSVSLELRPYTCMLDMIPISCIEATHVCSKCPRSTVPFQARKPPTGHTFFRTQNWTLEYTAFSARDPAKGYIYTYSSALYCPRQSNRKSLVAW